MAAAELINLRLGCCRHIYLCLQKDSWAIDYQATLNTLNAARKHGASHFVLLSAICVQKPLLEFQHAKLKFEETLQSAGDITYSIVRPTAFFKSLAGQVIMHLAITCLNRMDTPRPATGALLGWKSTLCDLLHSEGLVSLMPDTGSCWQGRGRLQAVPTDADVRRRLPAGGKCEDREAIHYVWRRPAGELQAHQ